MPSSLTPFSEIERLFVRGAVIVCAVVALWFLAVLLRGKLADRRQARQRKDVVNPQAATDDKTQGPSPHG
jgi:hypothetical protein